MNWLYGALAALVVALYALLKPGDLDWLGVTALAVMGLAVFVTVRHLDNFNSD